METETARVVQVVELKFRRGNGIPTDPVRIVTQYRDFDGNLLAESDPCGEDNPPQRVAMERP